MENAFAFEAVSLYNSLYAISTPHDVADKLRQLVPKGTYIDGNQVLVNLLSTVRRLARSVHPQVTDLVCRM